MKYVILILLITVQAQAADVAFLEVHGNDGKPIQLEPGGRFVHVAIRHGRRWLHAHSHRGVELIDNLTDYGDDIVILQNPRIPDPPFQAFDSWVGKPFDFKYIWNNPLATYCTRLVAELLRVEPSVMTFDASAWKLHRYRAVGELGLSPDDLFEVLLERGFQPVDKCEQLLEKAT